jgi:hypothetical protein
VDRERDDVLGVEGETRCYESFVKWVFAAALVLAFSYVDRTAGPSAKGSAVSDPPTRDEVIVGGRR